MTGTVDKAKFGENLSLVRLTLVLTRLTSHGGLPYYQVILFYVNQTECIRT